VRIVDDPTQVPPPALGQKAARPKRILWKWTLAVAAVWLLFLIWRCGTALHSGWKLSDQAAQRFHAQLNRGEFDEICRDADDAFSQSEKHDELVHFLDVVHKRLGDAGVAKQVHLNVNATTDGTFVTSEFNTQFAEGQASETFTWHKSGDRLRLYNYKIISNALLK
jgi:hypothetical protein